MYKYLFLTIVLMPAMGAGESILVTNAAGNGNAYRIPLQNPPVLEDIGALSEPGPVFSIGYLSSEEQIFSIQYAQINVRPLAGAEVSTENLPGLEHLSHEHLRVSENGHWIYSSGDVSGRQAETGLIIDATEFSILSPAFNTWAWNDVAFSPDSHFLYFWERNVLFKAELPLGTVSTTMALPSEIDIGKGIAFFENGTYAYTSSDSVNFDLIRIQGSDSEHLATNQGKPCTGNPAGRTWYFYDYDAETVHAWNMDTETQTSFSAKFRDHLEPGQFTPNTGETFQTYDYRFDDYFILEPLRYDAAYVSPSGRYLVFAYGNEPKCNGYVSIYDLITSTWHAPIRVGPEDAAGLTNIVFLPDE